tara:strand:+ start:3971 stop:4423 length:453 start_codon:yes stop_codon:yes gene_type:complete
MKINNRRKCEFIMPDGFRCNRTFSHRGGIGGGSRGKYCEEHRRTTAAGLVKSTNVHAQSGNDAKMREWVIKEMAKEERLAQKVRNLNKRVDDLRNFLEDGSLLEARITKVIERMIAEGKFSDTSKLESMIMQVNNKVVRMMNDENKNEEE